MFVFGHLGLGYQLVESQFREKTSRKFVIPFMLGALLPDLIDKPLYYILSWSSGLQAAELGLISGTRTFGHTLIFLLVLFLLAYQRDRRWSFLALGCLVHLFLDHVGDWIQMVFLDSYSFEQEFGSASDRLAGFLFPLLGARFPDQPTSGLTDHLASKLTPFFYITEMFGLAILLRKARFRVEKRL